MTDEPRYPGVNLEESSPGASVPGVETTNAPERVSYPGVYLEETPGGKSIPGVATSSSRSGRGFVAFAKAFLLRRWRRPPSP